MIGGCGAGAVEGVNRVCTDMVNLAQMRGAVRTKVIMLQHLERAVGLIPWMPLSKGAGAAAVTLGLGLGDGRTASGGKCWTIDTAAVLTACRSWDLRTRARGLRRLMKRAVDVRKAGSSRAG